MRPTRKSENARTLAAALGLDTDEAALLLCQPVQITHSEACPVAIETAAFLAKLLERTFEVVGTNSSPAGAAMVEVVIGDAVLRLAHAHHVWVGVIDNRIVVSRRSLVAEGQAVFHPIFYLIAACYAAGAVVAVATGKGLQHGAGRDVIIDPKELCGDALLALGRPFSLGTAILAGAGAVGNAVLYALSLFDVRGVLHVVDPKRVNDGILNRCIWFLSQDDTRPKASVVCERAAARVPALELIPHYSDVATTVRNLGKDFKLERMIVGVDSRRARRSLQLELPREVYDASTTGIAEAVLHFNRQPTDLACLACIYKREGGEMAHEQHVADLLGVGIADVQTGFVTPEAAVRICEKYADESAERITGLAYDSLFKAMCGAGRLSTPEDRQVLAPFAFVSVLAGAFLALEMAIRIDKPAANRFNYWRISPWDSPVTELRQSRAKLTDCEVCATPAVIRSVQTLWDPGKAIHSLDNRRG